MSDQKQKDEYYTVIKPAHKYNFPLVLSKYYPMSGSSKKQRVSVVSSDFHQSNINLAHPHKPCATIFDSFE